MKTVNEIRTEAFRMLQKIITLKANIFNGCYSDQKELDELFPKIALIKKWAEENNQIPEIKHWFASYNFGQNNQFAATEISYLF